MAFYVTVRSGEKTGFLAGPFCRHGDALRMVSPARKIAQGLDRSRESWDYRFGTSRIKRGPLPVGLFNAQLGLAETGHLVLPTPPPTTVNRRVLLRGRGPAPAGYISCSDADCDEQGHFHPVERKAAA